MQAMQRTPTLGPFLLLALAAISILLAGCPAATMREAQSHFSAGASAENRQTIEELTDYRMGVPELSQQQALSEYQLACESVNNLIERDSEGLKNDKLLGSAMMLRVYSRWRVLAINGKAAQADADAVDSETPVCAMNHDQLSAHTRSVAQLHASKEITLGGRDAAMAVAIDGFLDHELGLAAVGWNEANKRFCSAVRVLDEAASGAPRDHDVRAFLYLAQIQTVGAWLGAADQFSTGDVEDERIEQVLEFAGPAVCGLQQFSKLNEPVGNGPINRLFSAQLKQFGISRRDFDCAQPQSPPDNCPSGDPTP